MGKTKGAALLRAAADKSGAQVALASRLGVSESALSRWLSGDRVPDGKSAIKLNKKAKIPFGAWYEEAE